MEDSGGILAHLAKINLFLNPVDPERNWYCYHPIFSGAIRNLTKISNPESIAATHRKAAAWYARNGYLENAFQQALASHDFEFTADLMEEYLDRFWLTHEPKQGLRWILAILEACNGNGGSGTAIPNRVSKNGIEALTRRGIEILKMMATDYRNSEIAEKAFISLITVKTHIKHIFSKLDVDTRVQAILWAKEQRVFEKH